MYGWMDGWCKFVIFFGVSQMTGWMDCSVSLRYSLIVCVVSHIYGWMDR